MRHVRLSQAAAYYGVCTRTLIRWEAAGKISVIRSPGGQRLYDLDSPKSAERHSYVYTRVSSRKQKDDLERQSQYLLDKYPGHVLVTDIGSGLNFKRKGLLSLLEQSEGGTVREIVVASKDRLCRFGFDLLAWHFQRHSVNLVVLDKDDKSPEAELAEDVLAVIQVFGCRWNGRRSYTGGTGGANERSGGESTGRVRPIRMRKIRLLPKKYQKRILDDWRHAARYSYNKAVFLMNETSSFNKMYLRNLVTPVEVNGHQPWLLETPKDIRAAAVFEAASNAKSCFTNLARGNIQKFELSFKARKKEDLQGWCLGIPKTAIKVRGKRGLIIYGAYCPWEFETVGQVGEIDMDVKLQFDGARYYLLIPYRRAFACASRMCSQVPSYHGKGVCACLGPRRSNFPDGIHSQWGLQVGRQEFLTPLLISNHSRPPDSLCNQNPKEAQEEETCYPHTYSEGAKEARSPSRRAALQDSRIFNEEGKDHTASRVQDQ